MSQYIAVRSKVPEPITELLFVGEILEKRRKQLHNTKDSIGHSVGEWVLSGYFLLGDGTWTQQTSSIIEPSLKHFNVIEMTKKEYFVMLLKEGFQS